MHEESEMVGTEKRHGKTPLEREVLEECNYVGTVSMHAELVQYLFVAGPGPGPTLASHTMFVRTPHTAGPVPGSMCIHVHVRYEVPLLVHYGGRYLRGLREPRVSPEPFAVLEEQDSCEMESVISAVVAEPRCRDSVDSIKCRKKEQ
jgi:hypothetical protein